VKVLIDAQLPIRLKLWLLERGVDTLHAIDLPNKEFSTDKEIIEIAEKDQRVVITKDSDFFKHFLLNGVPRKIIFVTTGNISNTDLLKLFGSNFKKIKAHFTAGQNVIELSKTHIKVLF